MNNIANWIKQNARPLEKALYAYHFENGSKDEVIKTLKVYQNKDGGFGHALEPDNRNPESNPIACWTAFQIIKEINLDKNHQMVKDLIYYLKTTKFRDQWMFHFRIPSDNLYPHAPWWHYEEKHKIEGYNPTAALLGSLFVYLDKKDPTYVEITLEIIKAIEYFITHEVTEMHELRCFNELYDDIYDQFDLEAFKEVLKSRNLKTIEKNPDKWFSVYGPKPTQVFTSMKSPGAKDHLSLIHQELQMSYNHRNDEGVFDIVWNWNQYPNYNKIAKQEWKGIIALHFLLNAKKYNFVLKI